MKISIIVVSYNTVELLKDCLDSVYASPFKGEMEVIVVDNASADSSAAMVGREFPQVKLIANPDNLGFAAANNQGYAVAAGKYIFLLNPDAVVHKESFDNAVAFMEKTPNCAMCGGKIFNSNKGLEPSARRFLTPLGKFFMLSGLSDRYPQSKLFGGADYKYCDHSEVLEVDWVPGTFACISREFLEKNGFFDERFYLYYEETDLCLRAKRTGWKIFFIPQAAVTHIGGAASKTRKDKDFDASGSQVMKFRMRAECLYYRKNFGWFHVLGAIGVEWIWYLLRWLVNCGKDQSSIAKREYSLKIVRNLTQALKDTSWGSVCPTKPW